MAMRLAYYLSPAPFSSPRVYFLFLSQRFFTTFSPPPRYFRGCRYIRGNSFCINKMVNRVTADLQFISAECCACPLFQPFCKRARVKKSTKGKGENGGRGREKGKIERNGEEEEEEGNNIAHRGII